MKLLLLFLGFIFVAIALVLLKPIAKNLPDMGFPDFLIGGFALSLLTAGLRMLWASFFVR
jgi:hypothetical protein